MRFRNQVLGLAAVAASFVAVQGAHASPNHRAVSTVPAASEFNQIVPNEINVKLAPDAAATLAASKPQASPLAMLTASQVGVSSLSQLDFKGRLSHTGWTTWYVPNGVNIWALARTLKRERGVIYAEPVFRTHAMLSQPNDPDFNYIETDPNLILYFGSGTAPTFRRLWHLDDTNAFQGWSIWPNTWYTASTKPSNAPIVAIIDTGADMIHPDFINAGGTGTDVSQGGQLMVAQSGQVFDDPNTGAISVVPNGSISNYQNSEDGNGHGTHVTGLALAAGNNGGMNNGGSQDGVIGIGYNARGMILQALNASGSGSDTDAAAAMYYAADNGASIINMSLGETNYSQVFQDAVTYAFQKGVLVVCAGDENGAGGGALPPAYPAACSGALAVTADGPNFASASYAGNGNYVDIAAPGGDLIVPDTTTEIIQYVFSTACEQACTLSLDTALVPPYTNNYTYLAGTSMACPIVSGAAALYYGMEGYGESTGWANIATYRALEASAQNVAGDPYGTWDPVYGYGPLDVQGLMQNSNARGSTWGAIKGIVYYNGTAVPNVAITATNRTTGVKFYTTSEIDGTYRFGGMPAGYYNVTAIAYGAAKTKLADVVAGTDLPGFDFWCGTYFNGDTTPPVVPYFSASASSSSVANIHQWGYDTETGIDSITIRIGSTTNGTDILGDTSVVADHNNDTFSGLSLAPGHQYFVTTTYTNGAGLTTTKSTTFVAPGSNVQLSGNLTLQDWVGGAVPVTVEIRDPGTTTVVESHTITVNSGAFQLQTGLIGTYDIAFKASHWLRKTIHNVNITTSGISGLSVSLINGDVNGDNQVGIADYSAVSKAFRSHAGTANWNPNADLNGDGTVGVADYSIISKNYRKTGDP